MITIADLRDHDAAIWVIMMGGIRTLGEATSPNTIWCADFNRHFAVGDGTRC